MAFCSHRPPAAIARWALWRGPLTPIYEWYPHLFLSPCFQFPFPQVSSLCTTAPIHYTACPFGFPVSLCRLSVFPLHWHNVYPALFSMNQAYGYNSIVAVAYFKGFKTVAKTWSLCMTRKPIHSSGVSIAFGEHPSVRHFRVRDSSKKATANCLTYAASQRRSCPTSRRLSPRNQDFLSL